MINTIFQSPNFTYHQTRTRDSLVTAIQYKISFGAPMGFQVYIAHTTIWKRSIQNDSLINVTIFKMIFPLTAQVNVTIAVSPANAGYIKISTITPGPLPWTGVYFNGNPVTISAYANPGFTFDHWNANAIIPITNTSTISNINITSNSTFTAVFNGTAETAGIVINEINFNSDEGFDSGNWVEVLNPFSATMELTVSIYKKEPSIKESNSLTVQN